MRRRVRRAWAELTENGSRPLVVRSSSTVEDGVDSSMAGRFESVLDVRGWDGFVDAVRAVVASGEAVHEGLPVAGRMAVLVQPFLVPDAGGVMFGADPVTGRRDRFVDRRGPRWSRPTRERRSRRRDDHADRARQGGRVERFDRRSRHNVRGLVALQKRAADVFGGPQDVEWAIVDDDVVMLQSRPITATGTDADATGPVFGPGPVAETFPNALAPLELDLWVEPMTDAIREVLRISGGAAAKKLAASPVIVDVNGHVAADLQLLGIEQPTGARSLLRPHRSKAPGAATQGRVAGRSVARCAARPGARSCRRDRRHARRGPRTLAASPTVQLIGLLDGTRQALRSVYGHEMLAGQLLDEESVPVTRGGCRVACARRRAWRRTSATKSWLRVTRCCSRWCRPRSACRSSCRPFRRRMPPAPDADEEQLLREALRLRGRWLQELTARAAVALGRRLYESGRLSDPIAVRALSFAELRALVRRELAFAAPAPVVLDGAPLPAKFRLTPDGAVVAVRTKSERATPNGGRGAGGGRASGVVFPVDALPADGAVLVVRTLDPGLASVLPGLRGLVSETGSVLSHLAILAREFGVPTVVGVEDAVKRFPPGTGVVVDGSTGEVSAASSEEVAA